jgi:hypothetical protein
LVLFNIDEFPNNTSWRFVPTEWQFTFVPSGYPPEYWFPAAFQEYATLTYSPTPFVKDFVGIKIGDVNGSADCENNCSLPFAPNDPPSDRSETLSLILDGRSLEVGESEWLDIRFNSPLELAAWQLGLNFDPTILAIQDFEVNPQLPGYTVEENFGLTELMDGKIRTIWVSPDARPRYFDGTSHIFRIKVQALRPIEDTRGAFMVDDNTLLSVGFQDDGTPITITKGSSIANDANELSGFSVSITATPNPFDGNLTFNIELPRAEASVQLIVYDAIGREVANWEGKMESGRNQFAFENMHTWGSGAFKYVFKTPSQTITGTVVKI